MDVARPREPLTDSALDRELEAALGVEPSPEFLARVRTRVTSEPEGPGWRLADVVTGPSRIGQMRVVDPLWGVAIVGIVLAVVVPQLMREDRPGVRSVPVATAAAPRQVERSAEATPDLVVDSGVRTARPRQTAEPLKQLTLSPVLFSDDDRNALALLVGAVGAGRVPPLPVSDEAADQSREMRELRIEPLAIEPLRQLARAPQEGEGQW